MEQTPAFENVTLEIFGKSFAQQWNWLLSVLVFQSQMLSEIYCRF